MSLYVIEWTHDDGMDQHEEFANLTPDQADDIRDLLDKRGALDPHVYEPMPTGSFRSLIKYIKEDLPL